MKVIVVAMSILGLLSTPGLAEAQSRVVKISDRAKKVAVSLPDGQSLNVGQTLKPKGKMGDSCTLVITSLRSSHAIADGSSCEDFEFLEIGNELVVSSSRPKRATASTDDDEGANELLESTPPEPTTEKPTHFYGVSLFSSQANEIESSGSIEDLSVKEVDEVKGALGLSFFYVNIPAQRAGSYLSFDFEPNRPLSKYKTTIDGNTYSGNFSSGKKVSNISLASNLAFGLSSQAFFYGGFNYPFEVRLTDCSCDLTGKFGIQFGFAFRFAKSAFGAVEYRSLKAKIEYDNLDGSLDIDWSGPMIRFGVGGS